jgi:hypothetical protein
VRRWVIADEHRGKTNVDPSRCELGNVGRNPLTNDCSNG